MSLITDHPAAKVQPVTSRVMEAIRETIIENNLQPGDALPPEGAIAARLGVSRASVREAVRSLVALGIIRVKHGQGIFVKGFDFGALVESLSYSLSIKDIHIQDLLEIREGLELLFVSEVVANTTAEDVQKLQAITARMKAKAARGEAFPAEDEQFHLTLYKPAGNDLLLRMIRIFWFVTDRLFGARDGKWQVDPVRSYEDHLNVVRALERRDVEAMRQQITTHYLPLRQQLKAKGLSKEETSKRRSDSGDTLCDHT